MIKHCCAVAAALLVIAASGAYHRARMDAMTSASLVRRQARGQTVYLLGMPPDSTALRLTGVRKAAADVVAGRRAVVSGSPRLRVAYDVDEVSLREFASELKEHLEEAGFRVSLCGCGSVMLRSKALAGQCDLFLTPRRAILRSDIARLGAVELKLPGRTERRRS